MRGSNFPEFDSNYVRFNQQRKPRKRSRLSGVPWGFLAIAGAILVLIGGAITFEVLALTNKSEVTFTVKDKQNNISCNNGDCKHKYLIFTDKGVYSDSDSLVYFKFNSSDVYGQLERGHKYTCKVYGFRIPFFSSYKNIVSCKAAQ